MKVTETHELEYLNIEVEFHEETQHSFPRWYVYSIPKNCPPESYRFLATFYDKDYLDLFIAALKINYDPCRGD